MRNIITLLLVLCSMASIAQTVTTPPAGSKPYGTPVATPSGEIMAGRTGSYTYITRKAYTDSLFTFGDISGLNGYRMDAYAKIPNYGYHNTEGGFARIDENTITYLFRRGQQGMHTSNTGDIYAIISSDNGLTWGAPFLVYSSPYDDRNLVVGNAPDGSIVVVFRRYDVDNSQSVDIGFVKSSNGTTYSGFTTINTFGDHIRGPFGTVFTRGQNTYFVLNTGTPTSTAYLYESTDDGDTWTNRYMLFENEDGIVEPFLVDIPGGRSIILARNQNNLSIEQYNSSDGVNFTYKGQTNIISSPMPDTGTPVFAQVDGDKLIVLSTKRWGSNNLDEKNVKETLNVHIQYVNDIYSDEEAYQIKHQIQRPYSNIYAWYGYPSLIATPYGFNAMITDRERGDKSRTTGGQQQFNEYASIYNFAIQTVNNQHDYISGTSYYGGRLVRNKINGGYDYVVTDNDSTGYEYDWVLGNQFVWRNNIDNPETHNLGGTARMAMLRGTPSSATGGWPQTPSSGGLVMLASSADGNLGWAIGRGATDIEPGMLFTNTRSSTGVWSGWEPLYKPSLTTDWNGPETGVFRLVGASNGSPTAGSSWGLSVSSTSGSFATHLAGRNGRYFLRSLESNTLSPWYEAVTSGTDQTIDGNKTFTGDIEAASFSTTGGTLIDANVSTDDVTATGTIQAGSISTTGNASITGTVLAANINELPSTTINPVLGPVIAGEVLTYVTSYTGVSSADVVTVGVSGSIGETDLIITASSTSTPGQVVVKFYNPTSSDISIGNITIKLKAFR